jgi:hypothetical protein
MVSVAEQAAGCSGFCRRCETTHVLARTSESDRAALELVETIRLTGRLDFDALHARPELSASTKYRTLAAPRRQGQMLGCLIAADERGKKHTLKAFSGQLNYQWAVDGWCMPLCNLRHDTADAAYRLAFRRIKQLSAEAAEAAALGKEELRIKARQAQKAVSNALLVRLRRATILPNFRGEMLSVEDASLLAASSSGGTGDCAAPKLLAAAARSGLAPLAMSEVWFGSGPPAGGRQEGTIYDSCAERCQPIVGFMLCGAEQRRQDFGFADG